MQKYIMQTAINAQPSKTVGDWLNDFITDQELIENAPLAVFNEKTPIQGWKADLYNQLKKVNPTPFNDAAPTLTSAGLAIELGQAISTRSGERIVELINQGTPLDTHLVGLRKLPIELALDGDPDPIIVKTLLQHGTKIPHSIEVVQGLVTLSDNMKTTEFLDLALECGLDLFAFPESFRLNLDSRMNVMELMMFLVAATTENWLLDHHPSLASFSKDLPKDVLNELIPTDAGKHHSKPLILNSNWDWLRQFGKYVRTFEHVKSLSHTWELKET